jgi:hypothetical protein
VSCFVKHGGFDKTRYVSGMVAMLALVALLFAIIAFAAMYSTMDDEYSEVGKKHVRVCAPLWVV